MIYLKKLQSKLFLLKTTHLNNGNAPLTEVGNVIFNFCLVSNLKMQLATCTKRICIFL